MTFYNTSPEADLPQFNRYLRGLKSDDMFPRIETSDLQSGGKRWLEQDDVNV